MLMFSFYILNPSFDKAPTTDAFAALGDRVLDNLLLPENIDALTDILTYHVIAGNLLSSSLESGDVKTLNGDTVKISLESGVAINDATVIRADVIGNNGIVHVLDKVIVPL